MTSRASHTFLGLVAQLGCGGRVSGPPSPIELRGVAICGRWLGLPMPALFRPSGNEGGSGCGTNPTQLGQVRGVGRLSMIPSACAVPAPKNSSAVVAVLANAAPTAL